MLLIRGLVIFGIVLLSACSLHKPLPIHSSEHSSKPFAYENLDYDNVANCQPFNIGHRLGGDLEGNQDNTLASLLAVISMQENKCFRYWEFDVGQASDKLVLWHDFKVGEQLLVQTSVDDLPESAPTVEEFSEKLSWLKIIKPVAIDLKYIPDANRWPELIQLARTIREQHNVPVWFLTNAPLVEVYSDLCGLLAGEFDIRLYAGQGDFCEVVKAYNKLKSET